jgi:hypothetical protein
MDMTFDYLQPESKLMLDLIKHSNGSFPVTETELSWGEPTAVSAEEHGGRDTSIVATVVNSDRYRGSSTFLYNRVPLRQTIPQCAGIPRIVIGVRPLLSQNLAYLNAALSLNLEVGSVDDIDLDERSVNYTDWTLVKVFAAAKSRVFTRSINLYLKRDSSLA